MGVRNLLLTKEQVITRVNKIKNLRKEFKKGSWYHFAGPSGVVPAHREPSPTKPHTMRDLYHTSAILKIANAIGYVKPKRKGARS